MNSGPCPATKRKMSPLKMLSLIKGGKEVFVLDWLGRYWDGDEFAEFERSKRGQMQAFFVELREEIDRERIEHYRAWRFLSPERY